MKIGNDTRGSALAGWHTEFISEQPRRDAFEIVVINSLKVIISLDEACCVIYDNMSNDSLVDECNGEKIYMGKKRSEFALPMEELTTQFIKQTNEGKIVIRLKGGDPFIFGSGKEEADDLAAAEITFSIAPCVST